MEDEKQILGPVENEILRQWKNTGGQYAMAAELAEKELIKEALEKKNAEARIRKAKEAKA